MESSGQWLSLMEYAMQNDVSLSTLRRHIKAQKVRYRSENGRYFIWQSSAPQIRTEGSSELQKQLQKAQKEIAELKTLVAFYEDLNKSPNASF